MGQNQEFVNECLRAWESKACEKGEAQAFMETSAEYPGWMLAAAFAQKYWNNPLLAADMLVRTPLCSLVKPQVQTIVSYYHRLQGGGAQKVFRDLALLWKGMGYRVALVVDECESVDLAFVPDGVKLFRIPDLSDDGPDRFSDRAEALSNILHDEHADVLFYHAWNSPWLPWDMVVAKLAGCAFAIQCHSVFSLREIEADAYFAVQPHVYRNADAIVCLSPADRAFWGNFNSHVFDVLNPVVAERREWPRSDLATNNLIWVGRFSPEKRPDEAIRIFARVKKSISGARLLLLGSAVNPDYDRFLRDLADDLGVKDSVAFCGFQDNISDYYLRSSVALATSEYEGFHISLFEAQAHGVPVVMYALPNLRWACESDGIFQVANGDLDAAAAQVVALLDDAEALAHAGEQSRCFACEFADYPLEAKWSEVLDSLSRERCVPPLDEAHGEMWDILLDHYAHGIDKLRQEKRLLEEALQHDLDCVVNSVSFRLGRALTELPRKLRDIVRLQ